MLAVTSKPAILGPVFWWELIRVSRRGYWHLCRFLFAATLLLYIYIQVGDRVLRVTELSEFSARLADIYAVAQFLAVLVFTPLLTCGAILEERTQRTLPLLLASLIHPAEVVQGKLLGRLLGLLTIILTGLPIVALLQFLGGIDFVMLLKETGIELFLMLVLGINGIYQSSRGRTLGGAVVRTYLQTAMHYLIAWMILLPPGLICFHLLGMSIYHFMATGGHFLACGFALIGLRRLTLNLPALALEHSTSELQFMEKFNAWTDVSHWLWRFKSSFGTPRESWEYRFQTQYHHDVEQDGDVAIRYYRVPEVSDRPLLWKDTWFPLDRRVQWLLTVGSIVLGCLVMGFHLAAVSPSLRSPLVMQISNRLGYAIMLGVMLLIVLRTTYTLTIERMQRTLDDLLILPWSAAQLLWEKWCGVLWRYRLLLAVTLLFILPCYVQTHTISVLWLLPVFVAQLSVVISLCMFVSLVCQLRVVWSRLLALLLVVFSLTALPLLMDVFWQDLRPVAMPASVPDLTLIHRSVVELKRDNLLYFEVRPVSRSASSLFQLYLGQMSRNVLCPLEAWCDLLHQQDYFLLEPSSVSFVQAMKTASPWHVHAVTTLCLLSISAFLFGCSMLMLRRWRSG